MSEIYGYARCSTDESRQDINRQKNELYKLGVKDEQHIYWEYASGTIKDRTELNRLLGTVKPGDTIATTEVSRLTRSTQHLCEMLSLIKEKKLQLIIGSFRVDCREENYDAMTKGMLLMWAVFAEMERDMISERVKSGMRNAKAKGKKIGRPQFSKDDIPDSFWRVYELYKRGEITISDMAKMMSCSRTTVYKYINEVKNG